MRGKELPFIKAVFSKQGNTGIAPGEGLGIIDSSLGVACLGLRANVLECNNGAVMAGLGGEVKTKSLTVLAIKRNHVEICLDVDGGRGSPRGRLSSSRSPPPTCRPVRPPPNHDLHLPGLFDPGPLEGQPRHFQ